MSVDSDTVRQELSVWLSKKLLILQRESSILYSTQHLKN